MNETVERYVYVEDFNCIFDRITKRKHYPSDMEGITDLLNRSWNQTKRFEQYCKEYKKRLEKGG